MIKNILRLLLSIIFLFSLKIKSQPVEGYDIYQDPITVGAAKCKEYGEKNRIKQFSDCEPMSNENISQICCYITGVNADKSHYDGCIGVNSTLFANKSIEFSSSGISGKLICTNNYESMNFINISFYNLLLIIVLFL